MSSIDWERWTTLDIEWRSEVEPTVLLGLMSFVTFRFGTTVWRSAAPGSWIDAVAVWALFGAAIGLACLSIVDIDLSDWGRHVAYGTLFAFVLGALSMADQLPLLGTDAMMFTAEAADVLLAGGNPYTASMQQSFALEGAAHSVATARLDGSMVDTWSYPAGTFLAATPARAMGIDIRYVFLAAAAGAAGVLVAVSPPEWALMGVGALVIPRNFLTGSLGGIVDGLWMLPVLIAMVLWYDERYTAAAFVLGIAAGTKQHPWLILPFLAVWVARMHESVREFARHATRLCAAGLAGFLALNLPFIVADPGAWLYGVTTPIRGSPMVPLGAGLTLLTRMGLYPVATWWHTLAVALVAGWLLLWYAYAWERVKWLAWVLPMGILAVNSRSLITYFVTWMPLLWMAILANTGRLDTRPLQWLGRGDRDEAVEVNPE